MKTVICLGNKACDIGELFENNNNYKVKLIDKDIEGENCFSLKQYKSPEEYEKNFPDLTGFLSDITEEVIFITSFNDTTSCSLKLLQQVKQKNITVVYLMPDTDFLTGNYYLENKLVFNVFQEYARSGLFKQLILLEEKQIDIAIGDLTIDDFYEKYISFIYNLINSINVIDSLETKLSIYSPPSNISRVATYGIYDLNSNNEISFFDIKNADDKCYNFFINDEVLKKDNKLLKKIKERMKEKAVDNLKVSYRIFSSSNDVYCYVTTSTKFIQEIQ